MKRWLTFLLALLVFALVHEGAHALVALAYDEYDGFHVRPYGFEVTYKTRMEQREGARWAAISGASNLVTLALGYVFLSLRRQFARSPRSFGGALAYWLTLLFLWLDALNLSLGPFLYGGDVNGIAVGLGVNRYVIQAVFLLVFLLNHELVVRKLLPAYGITTDHLLLRPWISLHKAADHS